jgi:rRNA-processing protein FCF1
LSFSKRLAYEILGVALQRVGDSNVLPHVHIWLVFLAYVVKSEAAIRLLENEFPWEHLVFMLNSLVGQSDQDRFGCKEFPVPEKGRGRPLPEDYILRGLEWARKYFPNRWFEDAQVDEEERSVEVPSMENVRIERILWLATQVAANGECLVYVDKKFRVHPALVTRIEEHQKLEATITHEQELGGSRMTPTSEDSDVDMTSGENESEDDDYVLVGQSEEVRRLKQQRRELESQLKSSGKAADPAEEPRQAVAKGPESLKENFSVLVVDTNLLLSQPEVFKLMVSTFNWSIVIPNTVITELLGLTNSTGPVGDAAKAAMIAINEALTDERDVKVVTAKGSNVTKSGFYKEQLDKPGDDEQRKIDDVIIETTKLQGEARRQAIPGDYGDYEAAVLITEDRNMRVKANARGVTAISASALKKVLSPPAGSARPERRSLGAPAVAPDWPEDEVAFVEPGGDFDPVLNVHPIGTVRKKRQLKRGKAQGADAPKVT